MVHYSMVHYSVRLYFILLVWTRAGAGQSRPLKGGLPSREANTLRGYHDLDFVEDPVKWRIRFWTARNNCLILWNEAGTYILDETQKKSGQDDKQDQAF